MTKAIFQAPNGKYYFKIYDNTGSSAHISEIIYKTEVEADKASTAFMKEEPTPAPEVEVLEVDEPAPKKAKVLKTKSK